MKINPLYKIFTLALEEVRKYLIENLEKGFIIYDNSLFTSPVLFIKKIDNNLRFYVNCNKLIII